MQSVLTGSLQHLTLLLFPLIPVMSYHWSKFNIVSDTYVPIFYAIAMGIDAVVALIIGKAYDRYGLVSLALLPLLTLPIPFFAFTGNWSFALVSIAL